MPASPHAQGFTYWALKIFALIVALFGLALAAGGLWLITLGGSWYYLLAGAGMLASGVLLFLQRLSGVWLYWLVFIGTLVWALWEVGLDPWALLPRVLALAVIALLSLAFVPWLRRHTAREVHA
ncbi:glucose dehydrogenase [Stutzerimonas balearica]|uniref:glucose dehydrogenase n=1 Tax=Stutzerimonas balearica TaxID=74829 RepID=UPI00190BD5A7|nr:glucose dehydrogenase [Stutzerimonas balearica]MBK3749821.1 glucose dehydrogenase [Stutzerimonas balearica]MBK3828016.1 glucose dehydrogenase [Stutzerimonas balearica]MBK3857701.1 glucose dehydrogenase [Stutzerimonas balearica]